MQANSDDLSPMVLNLGVVAFPLTNLCTAQNSVDIQMAVPGLRLADLRIECADSTLVVTHEAAEPEDPTFVVPDYARLAPGDEPLSIVDTWHVPSFEVTLACHVPMQLVRSIVEHGVLHIHLERRPALPLPGQDPMPSTVSRVVSFGGNIETLEEFVSSLLGGTTLRLECQLDPVEGPLNRLQVTIPAAMLARLEGLIGKPIGDTDGGICVIRHCG